MSSAVSFASKNPSPQVLSHSSGFPQLPMRKKEELWEMNIHENPMDDDVKDKLARTELSLKNNQDPFVDFVRHAESKFYMVIIDPHVLFLQTPGERRFITKYSRKNSNNSLRASFRKMG